MSQTHGCRTAASLERYQVARADCLDAPAERLWMASSAPCEGHPWPVALTARVGWRVVLPPVPVEGPRVGRHQMRSSGGTAVSRAGSTKRGRAECHQCRNPGGPQGIRNPIQRRERRGPRMGVYKARCDSAMATSGLARQPTDRTARLSRSLNSRALRPPRCVGKLTRGSVSHDAVCVAAQATCRTACVNERVGKSQALRIRRSCSPAGGRCRGALPAESR